MNLEAGSLRSRCPRGWLLIFSSFLHFKKLIYFRLHWVFVVTVSAFSSCSEWGLLFIAGHRLLNVVASLVEGHGLEACGLR